MKKKLHRHNVYRKWAWDYWEDDMDVFSIIIALGWFTTAVFAMCSITTSVLFMFGGMEDITERGRTAMISAFTFSIFAHGVVWPLRAWIKSRFYTDER